jgi:hypothetical protein
VIDTTTNSKVIQLVDAITSCLHPKLLKPEYRKTNAGNPMYGHCYVATEALYCLMKEFQLIETFKPFQAKDSNNISHWWLQNIDGKIIDITAAQYTSVGKTPPYVNGKSRPFMFPSPSKRARNVMNCVRKKVVDV